MSLDNPVDDGVTNLVLHGLLQVSSRRGSNEELAGVSWGDRILWELRGYSVELTCLILNVHVLSVLLV